MNEVAKALAPAIFLAKKGLIVDEDMAFSLSAAKERLTKNREAARIFYKEKKLPKFYEEVLLEIQAAEEKLPIRNNMYYYIE